MPNVLNEFAGDGVTRTFNFSMTGGYLSRDFVVFLTRPNDSLLDYTPYTGTVMWVSAFTVEISEPIPVGTTFVITRKTTPEALIDFQTTSRLTERNLDTAFNQSLHRTVELTDLTERRMLVNANLTEEAVAAAMVAETAALESANAANVAQSLVASAERAAVDAAASAQDATEVAGEALELIQQAVKGNVDSFNGRDGAVLPQQGDYTPDMVGFEAAGELVPVSDFSPVPAWSDPVLNAQAQSLANRSELIRDNQKRTPMVYATLAEAQAAAATLPGGQMVDVAASNIRYTVSGALLTGARPTTPLSVLSGVVRSVQDKLGQEFRSIKDYGAIGDGTNHPLSEKFTTLAMAQVVYPFATSLTQSIDWAACQAAAAGGGWVFAPAGSYFLTDTVKLPSNCTFTGEGIGRSIFAAPSTAQYESAFHTDCGTTNVMIADIELRGAFYRADGDYTTNPVQSVQMNSGIDFRGRYYQQQKNLPRTGDNSNFTVERVKITGFGYAGVHCDQIDNVKILQCDIQRCGAFGIRYLCCINHWAVRNVVKHISPGDPLNNMGNRVYGITTNRVYGNNSTDLIGGVVDPDILVKYRRPENGWFVENYVEDCISWKGLDTHGGKNINFLFNTVVDCHHAIGIDMGGYLARHGYARVEDIRIIGNNCYRYAPDNSNEGHIEYTPKERYTGAGAAINVGAKQAGEDGPANIMGYNLLVSGNNVIGWGEKGRLVGAINVFNFEGVTITDNIIRNSRGAAITLAERIRNGVVDGNLIQDVRYTDATWGAPFSRGVAVNSGDAFVNIQNNRFWNRIATDLKAIVLPETVGNVQIGKNYKHNEGAGTLVMYERPSVVPSCVASLSTLAQARVAASTGIADGSTVSFKGYGVAQIKKYAPGLYDIYLMETLANDSTSVAVTPSTNGFAGMGLYGAIYTTDALGAPVFRVAIRTSVGATADYPFFVQVFGLPN